MYFYAFLGFNNWNGFICRGIEPGNSPNAPMFHYDLGFADMDVKFFSTLQHWRELTTVLYGVFDTGSKGSLFSIYCKLLVEMPSIQKRTHVKLS